MVSSLHWLEWKTSWNQWVFGSSSVVAYWLSSEIRWVKIGVGYGMGTDEEEKEQGITRNGTQSTRVNEVTVWIYNLTKYYEADMLDISTE